HHVAVTYDRSGKEAGVKVFINGASQPGDVSADRLTGSIRTLVPFKVGQRNSNDKVTGGTPQDLRLYDRALARSEVDEVAKGGKAQQILAKDAKQRNAKENAEVFAWWLLALDQPARALTQSMWPLQQEETVLRSRGAITHVMQEKNQEPIAYV